MLDEGPALSLSKGTGFGLPSLPINKIIMRDKTYMTKAILSALALVMAFGLLAACSQPDSEKLRKIDIKKREPKGTRIYGPIDPVVIILPPDVRDTLKGVDSKGNKVEKIHIYFRSLDIAVYRDEFDLPDYIRNISDTFAAMSRHPEFEKASHSWDIQMQLKGTDKFINYSVTPPQAVEYASSGDLEALFATAEYVMINDKIIKDPEERLKYLSGETAP